MQPEVACESVGCSILVCGDTIHNCHAVMRDVTLVLKIQYYGIPSFTIRIALLVALLQGFKVVLVAGTTTIGELLTHTRG